MGEWERIVPGEQLSSQVIFTILLGGFVVLLVAMVSIAPGKVVSWWGMFSAIAFCAASAGLMWRAARAGVHFGRRGVLVYRATGRAEVVPWDEFVRFEASPVRATGVEPRGAVVHVVRSTGDSVVTPVKQSISSAWDRAFYFFDIVLSEAEFAAAVERLNAQARPYTSSA